MFTKIKLVVEEEEDMFFLSFSVSKLLLFVGTEQKNE
jgi:stalled ribosome rescue protein Dom34